MTKTINHRSIFFGSFILLLAALYFVAWNIIARNFEQREEEEAGRKVIFVKRALIMNGSAYETKGRLTFRRAVSKNTWDGVGRMTNTRLVTRPYYSKKLPGDFAAMRSRLSKGAATMSLSTGSIASYLPVYSGGTSPSHILRIEIPPAYNAMRRNTQLVFGIGAAITLLFLGGCFSILSRNARARAESEALAEARAKATPNEEMLRAELENLKLQHAESDELFRQMAVNASDLLYAMYPDSGRLDWYGQIDLLLGYAHGSFPRTIEAWAESIHPDEAERIISIYSTSCVSGEPFNVEYQMRHRNGTYRDWSHRGKPIFNKNRELVRVIGACSDITERKRAQRRLKESEERLAGIFETVVDTIILCDCEGKVTFTNQSAELLFGRDRKELVDTHYGDENWRITAANGTELMPSELPTAMVCEKGAAVHGIEQSITQPSGQIVIVSVNAAPLHDGAGQLTGSVLSLTDITGRKAHEERLAFQAFHDQLTKLPNRALFTDRLEHALVRAERNKLSVGVCFIDLDNFKKTNDTMGHDAGDALLIATAERLDLSIRGGDTAARLGGDEFTIMLENITEPAQVEAVAARVLKALLEPVHIKGQDVYAPPSIGIAISQPGQNPAQVMADADAAMYIAKQNGKARYEFFVYEPAVEPAELVS